MGIFFLLIGQLLIKDNDMVFHDPHTTFDIPCRSKPHRGLTSCKIHERSCTLVQYVVVYANQKKLTEKKIENWLQQLITTVHP